jgi:hypothetical protein
MVHELYFEVLRNFERLDIPYVIIGAFAGIAYGVTRTTFDVDIVADISENNIQALAKAFPPPRFYADPDQMRDSIRLGILFNIIDSSEGSKVDLIPLTMKPGYDFALANRIRRKVRPISGDSFEVWFARPEDIIVGKLMAWEEGRAFKHETDIRDILTAIKLGDDVELSASFDIAYIDDWTFFMGEEVQMLWQNLKRIIGI